MARIVKMVQSFYFGFQLDQSSALEMAQIILKELVTISFSDSTTRFFYIDLSQNPQHKFYNVYLAIDTSASHKSQLFYNFFQIKPQDYSNTLSLNVTSYSLTDPEDPIDEFSMVINEEERFVLIGIQNSQKDFTRLNLIITETQSTLQTPLSLFWCRLRQI